MNRAIRLWLGLFPVLLGVIAVCTYVSATGQHDYDHTSIAVVLPIIALSFVISGLFAWTQQPDNGTGRLLVLVGVLWATTGLYESDNGWVIGFVGAVRKPVPGGLRPPPARVPGRAARDDAGAAADRRHVGGRVPGRRSAEPVPEDVLGLRQLPRKPRADRGPEGPRRCVRGDLHHRRRGHLHRGRGSARAPLAPGDQGAAPDPRARLPVRWDHDRPRRHPLHGRLLLGHGPERSRGRRVHQLRDGPAVLPRRPAAHPALPRGGAAPPRGARRADARGDPVRAAPGARRPDSASS